MRKKIIIGTRESDLALVQTEIVIGKLKKGYPELEYQVKKISTEGDRKLDKKLSELQSEGLFIKEIEIALLNGEIDLAVHSFKDLPTVLPAELKVAAIPARANPVDTLVGKGNISLAKLPAGARLGTGSLRRKSQLLSYRNNLEIVPIRGNIGTRLERIKELDLDGVILAAAGLERLGWQDKITEYLDPEIFVPSARQGAIVVEIRRDDDLLFDLLKKTENKDIAVTVWAEHAFLKYFKVGCHAPIGAFSRINGDQLVLTGFIGKADGSKIYREKISGRKDEPEILGHSLAEKMIRLGADKLLAGLKEGKR